MQKAIFLLLLVAGFGISYGQEIPKDSIKQQQEELDEIIVQSTRTSRTIKNTPTRVETIDAEELDEKANMQARAGVTMVLHESTGLQVQQTSATSGNASVRVQGLDGRYTQLLKDGYPNFGNFAGGLSLLEMPPLDLKQVEIIKGPASTLYGGGAIAGAINFISKTPGETPENIIFINQSHIGQTNLGVYSSRKIKGFGYSVLLMENAQQAFDVDNDDFSEVPKSNTFTIDPKIYYYPNAHTSLLLGNSFTKGNLKGGDMQVLSGNTAPGHSYFEQNETFRNTTTFEFTTTAENKNSFKFKQSLSIFDRKISIPDYLFSGLNTNAYTDASYVWNKEKHTVIGGVNLVYDNFKERDFSALDAKSFSSGVYLQDTWDISERIILENGLRIDNANYSNANFSKNQTFLLPKISALFKISSKFSSRVGGGLGYKIPTIFTEKTEETQYRNLRALDNVEAEQSIGATADINYKTSLSADLSFSINQMFYLTQINKPLLLQQNAIGESYFVNASEPVISQGFETNIKFILKEDIKFFIGYTFIDAKAKYLEDNQFLALLPKNKLNLALIYEKESNFKLGLEGYFTDRQLLTDQTKVPSFWEFGFMAQKTLWKHFDFFINFENFTDVKQSDYKPVVNGDHNNPTFDEIWTHTEGFIFNGGLKVKF